MLTGHKDGKVLVWRMFGYAGLLENLKDEVVSISHCFEGIAVATARGFIHLWDTTLSQKQRTIELSKLPGGIKVTSMQVVGMDFNQKRLLVLTLMGDVLEFKMN